MKRNIALLTTMLLAPLTGLRAADEGSPAREAVRLILETDMSGDCDDAGALALLHALADRGECALLAVLTNRKDESNASAAAADAINTYYGRPDIPIGTDKQGPTALQRTSPYAAALRDEFPNDIGPDDRAPDALEVYRRVLPAQPDGSVTICSVGALSNLAELCRREPELVRTKVLRLVVMGGEFPERTVPEVNIMTHKEAAQIVVAEWPGEMVWHGFEVGNAITTGAQFRQTPRSNPVRRAYELRQYKKRPSIEGGQPSYDQAAALFAVRDAEPEFWEVIEGGRVGIDPDGLIQWQADPAGRHSYVKILGAPQRLAEVIEALMIAPPTGVSTQNQKGSRPAAAAPVADRIAPQITTQDPPGGLIPPYPPSTFIESLTIDASRVSIGDGDNWANTWGDDDRMYSFFTDGRGFDRRKSVSCAPAIIEGHPPQISGHDLVSPTGTIPDPSGKNSRKVCGLLMVDGVLYAWVRNLNLPDAPKGTGAGMMVSTDRGRTWQRVDWNWPELGYPVWMNAGRNYRAARDEYAYYLSPDGPSAYADYPHLALGRVPVASIRDQAAHEFFAGLASPGVPRWGRFESRKPVFTDPNGCFRPNLVYNPGLKRYFLVMSSPYGKWKWWATDNPNRRAHLGIFDAPTPWGPWSVVDYVADWGAPENRFAPNIPSKWISVDGTTFYLLYSCIPNGPYQFNVQRCTVKLKRP